MLSYLAWGGDTLSGPPLSDKLSAILVSYFIFIVSLFSVDTSQLKVSHKLVKS